MSKQHLEQIVKTFREEEGFNRLFSSFYKKYKIYERIENNITIVLENPSIEEKSAIGGLLGLDYTKSKSIKVTASKVEKALKKTKYGSSQKEMSFEKIVEAYFGGDFQSKREEKELYLSERKVFFSEYISPNQSQIMNRIIDWIEMEGNSSNRYYLQYKQDKVSLKRNLDILSNLLKQFPLKEPIYLPIFASKVTRNPHAFDMDREEGKLVIYSLQVIKEIETGEKLKQKLNAEEITELLLEYNLLRDDLTNYVTVFNVDGKNKNGEINHLLNGLKREKAATNLPLREVIKLESVKATHNVLYMVENSSVSSCLMNEIIKKNKNISVVCGNGMLKLAALKFLDVFTKGGGVLYYSGDFDPEGLGITQRLMERYGDSIRLWRYTIDDYLKSLSSEMIDNNRLNQLQNNITRPELMDLKEEILKNKLAGYQENIIQEIMTVINGNSELSN